jgi:hypothetical protein
MLFFDGWGLGADDPAVNPFLTAPLPTLRDLFGGTIPTRDRASSTYPRAIVVPTDATLGVEGLPQSGTGQTTILTGINAARAIGRHYGPYPNAALVQILQSDNIYHRLRAANKTAAFANAYPPFFFDRLARNKARRSAMTYAPQAAGVRLRDIDDLRAGRAVSAFLTNARWRELGADVPLLTARQAGQNLARLAREHDFTLFEYFLTDVAGHKQRPDLTTRVLDEIDGLYRGVLDETDLSDTLFITTSDHGNLEDTGARGHTRNPVPTILIGAGREKIAPRLHSLTDLAPALLDLLLEK